MIMLMTILHLKINQINIDNLKSCVDAYEQITKTHNENDILHIILYNDLFCVYEKNNVAYEYLFYNNPRRNLSVRCL